MHDERKRYGEGKEKLVERGWVRQPCAKDGWQNGGISFYYAWSLGFPLRFEELAYRSSKKRDIRRRNESLPGSLIVDFDERFYARYVFSPSLLSWPDPSSQPSYKSYQLPFRRFDLSSFDGRRYESSVSLNSVSVNFVRDSGQICFFKALQRTEFFYRKQYTENCRISKPLVRRNIVIKCYFSRFPSYTFGFHKLSSTYRLFFSLDGIIKLLLFNCRPALSVTNKLTSY